MSNLITVRDAEGILIAKFGYAAGMSIIEQAEGKWRNYKSKDTRTASQCFEVTKPSVFTIGQIALYFWEGTKFIIGE